MADIRRFIDGRTRTYDADLLLGATGYNYATSLAGKDAKNASAAAASDGYVDLGDGYTQGFACFDLHTIASGTASPNFAANAHARLILQGAKDTAFATCVPLGIVELGDISANAFSGGFAASSMASGDDLADQTRYFVPFHNRYGDEIYRYVRMWVHIGGSLATLGVSGFLTGLH